MFANSDARHADARLAITDDTGGAARRVVNYTLGILHAAR